MSTPIQISQPGAPAAPTFAQPFDMLEACHQRLHRTLGLLDKLRAHLAAHGADQQAQQAARDVMRYFDEAAPQHHHDEELHVFPPLAAHGSADTVALVARLRADHLQMEGRWPPARAVLAAVAQGTPGAITVVQAATLDAFAGLYGAHIEAEEQLAYPQVLALLDQAAIAAMGQEMARRRGSR
ncbi:hemerythrin domain-containing protein [Ramlibacter sp.]|uniref:hemerythrin domain-containing protein n=1 Tax=Ramlibacter sp. TaxID=1917967 RepID=UPI0018038731|nr:hemerythrin domain-containing protein [Ramlibacter sp.]MBA2672514.1 hemerythrin domain-containing protein [Ramlibacter sp.]